MGSYAAYMAGISESRISQLCKEVEQWKERALSRDNDEEGAYYQGRIFERDRCLAIVEGMITTASVYATAAEARAATRLKEEIAAAIADPEKC